METWQHILPSLAVVMLRPFGVLLVLPIFSSRALGGGLIRNALIIVMALPMLPIQLEASAALADLTPVGFVLLVVQEMLVGFLIGFCATLPFWAIDMAGTVIDTVRGSSMSSVLNPMLGEQSSIFSILFSQVIAVMFLVGGGFNVLLEALYKSYESVPPLATLTLSSALPAFIGHQWQAMMKLCVGFALPAIVVMVLVDAALGLVNRTAQQLNVFFVAMPIKSGLALFVMAVGLTYALSDYVQWFDSFGSVTHELMESLRDPGTGMERGARR